MSIANVSRFIRPADLAAAVAAVRSGALPVSGGTDVMLHPPERPIDLVDLTVLPLAGIESYAGGVRVGANTTLSEMLRDPRVAGLADGVIAAMLTEVGSPLLRNRATIGGHLARGRLSDVIPVLVALDATVTWNDGTDHTQALAAFYREDRHKSPLVITAVTIPRARPPSGAAFRKFARTAFELAILNCACRVDLDSNGRVAACRIVVGETPSVGASLGDAEVSLIGRQLTPENISAASRMAVEVVPARSDERSSAEYRRSLAGTLVHRCLMEIAERIA